MRRRVNEKLCLEEVQRHADRMLLLVDGAADGELIYFLRSSAALSRQLKKVDAMKQASRKNEKTMLATTLSFTLPVASAQRLRPK